MAKAAPKQDAGDARLAIKAPKSYGAGVPGVVRALEHATTQMGVVRSALTLTAINQKDGFDCPGCAWPDPDHRHAAEFCGERRQGRCRGGDPAPGHRRVLRHPFGRRSGHPLRPLARPTGDASPSRWCCATAPRTTNRSAGTRRSSWSPANCGACRTPTRRSSTPRAGRPTRPPSRTSCSSVPSVTNNLPDCSNMCHESSGSALGQTLGIGKGTVTLEDIHDTDLVIIAG